MEQLGTFTILMPVTGLHREKSVTIERIPFCTYKDALALKQEHEERLVEVSQKQNYVYLWKPNIVWL